MAYQFLRIDQQGTKAAVRLIQITDCHLGPLSSESLLGLNTDQSLEDVLQLIQEKEPHFDQLLCTGDIASAGHLDCYKRFSASLRRYFPHPLGWLPGNHDSAAIMASHNLDGVAESRLMKLGNWLIVLLDSSVPGHVYGHLDSGELDFLVHVLRTHPENPVMVALHHQLVPVGSAWIDQYIVSNAEAVFSIIDSYPQVKLVTWGHVHQEFKAYHKKVTLLATPSTCVQFKPKCDQFTVDTQMPGYRWYELNDDGTFTTGIERVTGKQYVIDYKSAGY